MTNQATPVSVSGLAGSVQAIAAGDNYLCALLSGGGVACWGDNTWGQLGDNTQTTRTTPVSVSGLSSSVQAIAAGSNHTCALHSGGGVQCWGYNFNGQLGDGTTTTRTTPVSVSGLSSGVQAISAGSNHTCALLSGGGVQCWGFNGEGQLGDGTFTSRRTPVAVSGLSSGVQAVATGGAHSCALHSGGGVQCWGYNRQGQLGDGTVTQRSTPMNVIGLSSGLQGLEAGGSHTCVRIGGGVKCWGSNNYGQLGDGSQTNRTVPVIVSGLYPAPTPTPTPTPVPTMPDANRNGVTDATDALCILRLLGSFAATANCPSPLPFGDVNGRDGVTSVDALCVLRYLGGFPRVASCPYDPPA